MQAVFEKPKFRYLFLLGFWLLVFIMNTGPEWQRYSSVREMFDISLGETLAHAIVAFVTLKFLVPKFLDKEQWLPFLLCLLLLLFVTAQLYISYSYFYLEPTYAKSYGAFYLERFGDYSWLQRIGFSEMIQYIVFMKMPKLLFPTAVLVAIDFYRKQKNLIELQQQKQAAELNALKNQLNPHFIFNTLNNIYSLAIKKSDLTAEAVAKLSGILDYVLYRGSDSYVSLNDEIEMIESYIALEKLRFGERVQVNLSNQVKHPANVAPLLYLSLVENAFKHGASQELGQAHVNISFESKEGEIVFAIENSKPSSVKTSAPKPSIGLKNLKRQLELLYPNAHTLRSAESPEDYSVTLTLENRV